ATQRFRVRAACETDAEARQLRRRLGPALQLVEAIQGGARDLDGLPYRGALLEARGWVVSEVAHGLLDAGRAQRLNGGPERGGEALQAELAALAAADEQKALRGRAVGAVQQRRAADARGRVAACLELLDRAARGFVDLFGSAVQDAIVEQRQDRALGALTRRRSRLYGELHRLVSVRPQSASLNARNGSTAPGRDLGAVLSCWSVAENSRLVYSIRRTHWKRNPRE